MAEIRLGLIGTGKISTQLADAARAAGSYRLSAILSRDLARGEAFAAENGIERAFSDEEAFFSSGLDAVYVATPNCHHAHGACAAAAHGLHVLCEKPTATSYAEWQEMRRVADQHGVVLMGPCARCTTHPLHCCKSTCPALAGCATCGWNTANIPRAMTPFWRAR